MAHFVAYQKLVSNQMGRDVPDKEFRLVAATMHHPRDLFAAFSPRQLAPGVYEITWAMDHIRILVMSEIDDAERNLVWNLFSRNNAKIASARFRLAGRPQEWSSILNDLFGLYGVEGFPMPLTWEEYFPGALRRIVETVSKEERSRAFEGVPVEMRLEGVPLEKRLEGMPIEEVAAKIPIDVLRRYLQSEDTQGG